MSSEALPGVAALWERFTTYRYSVFRLETFQVYGGSGEDEAIAAFLAGEPPTPDVKVQEYAARVRAAVQTGRTPQRVHVVVEPPTDYMRFELTGYRYNVDAGEEVRIIPVTDGQWAPDVPHWDFWLFDSSELWDMSYTDDGTWLGVEPLDDPARIVAACHARDAALHQSISWAQYIRRHQDLARHLPATITGA